MDIPPMADGMQTKGTALNSTSLINFYSGRLACELKPLSYYAYILTLLIILFFGSATASFGAGSMQGAFIDAGDKQAAKHAYVKDVTERVLLPAFETFALQSRHLSQASETFCNAGRTAEQFKQLKSSWNTTKAAWAQTLPFRFGPALDKFIDLKIQFWPDDKNLTRRQIRNFLRDNPLPSVEQVAKASSPVQGLSAMEYLIYDADEGGLSTFIDGNQRCAYLVAVAQNTSTHAQDLLKAWGNSSGGYLASFSYSANPQVVDESFAVILREALVAIEVIKNLKVGKPFGLHLPNAKNNAFFLESWRSQRSQEDIVSNLITFQQVYYGGSRFGLDDLLVSNYNETELEFGLRTQISKCLELAAALPKPLFTKINEPAAQREADQLHKELIKLIAIIKQSLSQTLGITIGFSSNDGD